jgi:hypothetical protein
MANISSPDCKVLFFQEQRSGSKRKGGSKKRKDGSRLKSAPASPLSQSSYDTATTSSPGR